jgi:hypothetical protein
MTTETENLPVQCTEDFAPRWVKMSAEDYHANRTALSRSGATSLLRSPAHFYSEFVSGQPQKQTDALRFGKVLHSAILEPTRFRDLAAVQPEFGDLRTKVGKEARDAWTATLKPDAIRCTQAEYEQITAMVNEVWSHPVASNLLKGGLTEPTGFWRDEETGVLCRIRLDALRDDPLIVDLKTTMDASEREAQKAIARYMYHVQTAWYLDGASAIMGAAVKDFVFIFVEKEPPYDVGVYVADARMIEEGRRLCRRALNTYAKCLRSGQWPGCSQEAKVISLPPWAFESEAA